MSEEPYIFAVSDHELLGHFGDARHAIVAQRLTDAGYDVGLMLWTATPSSYTRQEIHEKWGEALKRAGIIRFECGRDEAKQREWFKVLPRPTPPTRCHE